jgi:hypothetical protein
MTSMIFFKITQRMQNIKPPTMMWAGLFKTKDTRKRPAAAAALITPRSDNAKKLKQNETPTHEDPAPRAVAPPVSANGLRSMAEAHRCRDLLMPGADMCCLPVGPCETENEIIEAVQAWAANPEINGGAFGITRESLKPALKTKGPRRLLVCDRSGQARRSKVDYSRPAQRIKKCNCTWNIYIEQCEEGWVTVEMPKKARELLRQPDATVATIHNHTLLQTVAESYTNANLRSIPDDLKDMAETLSWAACSSHEIFLALSCECQRLGRAVTFTRKDVYNRYAKQSGHNALDCYNLIVYLKHRQAEDSSLPFDFHLSQDHILERAFLVVKGGIERWKRCKAGVLRYDTQLGTNRYGHEIGCLTYFDETGKAQLLAISLLLYKGEDEDEESLTWVFNAFSKAFGDDPVVAFTDSDPAMAPAIALAWPNTLHLLCSFPLVKNVYKHIYPLFVQRPNEWKIAASRWWKLCEDSDESSMQEQFPAEWDALATFIAGNANGTEKTLDNENTWIQRMKESVVEWATCYT